MSDVTKKSLLALTALIVLTLIVLFLVAQFVKPTPDWLTWMPIFGSNTTNTSGTGTGTGTATGTDTDASKIIDKLKALGDSAEADLSSLLTEYNTYKTAVTKTKAVYDTALTKIASYNAVVTSSDQITGLQTTLNTLYTNLNTNISGFADFINKAAKNEAGTNTLTTKSSEYLANSQTISSDIGTLIGQITTYLEANSSAKNDLTNLLEIITSLTGALSTASSILSKFNILKGTLSTSIQTTIADLNKVAQNPDDVVFFIAVKTRVQNIINQINEKSNDITKILTTANADYATMSTTINNEVVGLNTKSTSLVNMAKTLKDYKTEITSRQTIEGKRASDLTLVNSIFLQNAKLDIALTQLTAFYTGIKDV